MDKKNIPYQCGTFNDLSMQAPEWVMGSKYQPFLWKCKRWAGLLLLLLLLLLFYLHQDSCYNAVAKYTITIFFWNVNLCILIRVIKTVSLRVTGHTVSMCYFIVSTLFCIGCNALSTGWEICTDMPRSITFLKDCHFHSIKSGVILKHFLYYTSHSLDFLY